MDSQISQYSHLFLQATPEKLVEDLSFLRSSINGVFALSTSFSLEDQLLTHVLCTSQIQSDLFTLDTGRLFKETYSTWEATLERYKRPIKTYTPEQKKLDEYISEYGPNAFYSSVEKRKLCCHIRKVIPLQRALSNVQVWITGIRAQHSGNRTHMRTVEWDETYRLIKVQPLLHWKTEEVDAFIKEQHVPYNPLHDHGFVSIGCSPCTRAIRSGEDFRAGRWWWEDADKKECGLHENRKTT
jgi:phosphoadenosine phosphosulfate reductase